MIKLAKVRDRATGAWRYVASNQVSPEIFNQLAAEGEQRRKEASMAQKNVAAADNAAIDAARAEGIEAERKRYAAIISSPWAAGKETYARTLADSGVPVETAVKMLETAPAEKPTGYRSIEERAASEREVGMGAAPLENFGANHGKSISSGPWGHVVNKLKGAK